MVHLAKKLTAKSYIAVAVLAALFIVAGGFLLLRNHSKQTAVTIPSTSPSPSSKKPASSSSAPNSTNSSTPSGESEKTASNATGNGPGPIKPFGDFVSNHIPGGTNPTQESSACNTTPGASCYIKFTNTSSGASKQLAVQTVDSNGSAIWNWDVKDAGFSEGSWQVSAIASLNGQTQTTQDPRVLQVRP